MNFEDQLKSVADGYKVQGYGVVVRPGPNDLPEFAKDFSVEVLATRPDGNVLAAVKKNSSHFYADTNLPKYAAVIDKTPGWRFDLFVMGKDKLPPADLRDAKEPSEEAIRRQLDDAERMFEAGFAPQAVVAAWAALESSMRRRLRAEGEEADWGTSPQTMLNELYSSGVMLHGDFRELEGLFQLRSLVVHGFSPPVIENATLHFLIETSRRFLDESRLAKQSA